MTKKNKILFFIFSLIPGAAHMYLGLMKRGLVLMTLFVLDIGISMIAEIFLVLLPVMWFYCFFDAWNKYALPEEKLAKVDDSFIFVYNAIPEEILPKSKRVSAQIPQKLFKVGGVVCICFGAYIFWEKFLDNILYNLPEYAAIVALREISNYLPQIAISTFLIVVGIKLIAHKKKELERSDENEDIYSDSDNIEIKK